MGASKRNAGGNPDYDCYGWTSIPSRGRRNTPSHLHATETRISSGLIGNLACTQTAEIVFFQSNCYQN